MQRYYFNLLLVAMILAFLSSTLLAQPSEKPIVEGFVQTGSNDPKRFEKSIIAFEKQDQELPPAKGGILFVGSSSIRLWPVKESFPNRTIIHRGFGGSTTTDLNFYFDRIVLPYEPKVIVYYEGDNDLGQKISPTKIIENTSHFIDRVHKLWPETVVLYIPVKPSIKRWGMWVQIQETHKFMREIAAKDDKVIFLETISPLLKNGEPDSALFKEDGLHLNEAGYQLWTPIVEAELAKYFPKQPD
jgi:lysophospholipase L1-like esterase